MATKKESVISEQEVQEIVERMGRRESRGRTSLNDFYKRIGLEPDEPEHTDAPGTSETGTAVTEEQRKKRRMKCLKEAQVTYSERLQCRRNASAASSAGCRWTSTVPLTCKSPRLQTASPCLSAARCATAWTG